MLNKKKKIIIITSITILILAIVTILFLSKGKKFDENNIEKVIGNEIKIESLVDSERSILINLSGDIDKEEAKKISKDILKIDKNLEKDLVINFIERGKENKNEFYYDGLKNRATHYKGSSKIEFESFVNKEVEKNNKLGDISSYKIISNYNNNLILSLEMKLNELSEEEAVGQVKAYIEMFKRINDDKNIQNVQVNVTSDEKGYNFSEKYNDVFSIVEYL